MAYSSSAVVPRHLTCTKTPAPTKRGLLSRWCDVMMASHQRQTEREIGYYLRDTGGKFTDEAEREIQRRFLFTQSRW